jgi:hypothetical protein
MDTGLKYKINWNKVEELLIHQTAKLKAEISKDI